MPSNIEPLIYTIRCQRVILDADLAQLYGVTTKRLNEQVKRNAGKFPEDFAFQLTPQEVADMRSQIVTASERAMRSQNATAPKRNIRFPPYAFTEHGAIMAANVVNSPQATQMSVFVVRAFVRMRNTLAAHLTLEKRLAEIESMLMSHDAALRELFKQIRPLLLPPPDPAPKRIGFGVREPRVRYTVKKEEVAHA